MRRSKLARCVQRNREVQGITGPKTENGILQEFSGLAKTIPLQRPQLNPSLEQAIELPGCGLAIGCAQPIETLLQGECAVGFGDQPVGADQAGGAVFKPVNRVVAALFCGEHRHDHACVQIDHRL